MTFDEAVDVVVYLSDASDIMEQYEQESWSYENPRNATLKLLEELRKEYVPTIEMTREQKENWDKVTETNGGTGTLFFVVKHLDHNLFPNNQETDDLIARAWLTPELIKVVD